MQSDFRFFREIGAKWQEVWEQQGAYEANPDKDMPKFFLTAAYMYPNSPIHIGHARTYLIADVLARFYRHKGYNVLFPMGFHYTGTPILTMAEAVASGDRELISLFKELYDVPDDVITRMSDPLYLASYFHSVSKEAMKRFGLSVDWRREFTTIDEEYKAFIQWQFRKLLGKGYLEKGTHPVGWCPLHSMPVGAHDTKDDKEPEIGTWTLIFFQGQDAVFPAATLRPETVFGVTNVWVNPSATYVRAEVDGKMWVLSEEAANKLAFQRSVRIVDRFEGSALVGRTLRNPVTREYVPIYPARFVDPRVGTGVVMSVPSHAPYDYVALKESGYLRLVPLIEVPGYGESPAADVVERMGISTQSEREKLEEATREVYSAEYNQGRMRRDITARVAVDLPEEYKALVVGFFSTWVAGLPVREARENLKRWLLSTGLGDEMYDIMNRPVYCRCGTEIVVKILTNQWFINYGKPEWKQVAREALSHMRIVPEEARAEFEHSVEWLQKRACARTRGLGTPLPWEEGWVIESLSDSTIYMAFYTVIHKIRGFGIRPERLDEDFWDFVFLGSGTLDKLRVDRLALDELRREFEYWYPLDSRHSAKDLIPNHLTFFIFNHVAIFPRDKWPRQIVANGWVLVNGEKMAKSKRNILPLHRVLAAYGPDPPRVALSILAEVGQDLDFREEGVAEVASRLRAIYDLFSSLMSRGVDREQRMADRWLLSAVAKSTEKIVAAMESVRVREAAVEAFYVMYNNVTKYLELVESPHRDTIRKVLSQWVILMEPFAPHLAEELWHMLGNEGLVVKERLHSLPRDPEAELALFYVDQLIEDIRQIMNVTGRKGRVHILVDGRISLLGAAMRSNYDPRVVAREAHIDIGKARKLVEVVRQLPEDVRDVLSVVKGFDEMGIIGEFRRYITERLGVEDVRAYDALHEDTPDMYGKKKVALPLKPGIYIE